MACNSFLIRVHGRVLSRRLCRVSAAEVLEVRFLPRCFFLARRSQAQSLLRCRSALHTQSSFEEGVLTVKTQCVCVWKSLGSGFSSTQFNTLKCIKITNRMLVSVQLRPASAFTPRCIFFSLALSLTLYLSLSLVSPDDGALRIWKNFADQKNPEMVTAWQGLSDMLPTTRGQPSISTHSKDQRSLLLCHQPIRSPTHTPKPQTVPKHPSHTSSLLRLQRRSERRFFFSLN